VALSVSIFSLFSKKQFEKSSRIFNFK